MKKLVRSLIATAALAALCLPFQASAASYEDWESLGIPGLTLDPPNAMFFQWTAVTSNSSSSLLNGLDFGLAMYQTTVVHEDDSTTDMLNFAFINFESATVTSSITDIYFHQPSSLLKPLLADNIQESPNGPSFTLGATPSNPPGYNSFGATFALGSDSAAPISPNGVESVPEWVILSYEYNGTNTYDHVLQSLFAVAPEDNFRIAMHVQSITGIGSTTAGTSDTFAWTPVEGYTPPRDNVVVPVPAAAGLGFLGMALIGVVRRKKA